MFGLTRDKIIELGVAGGSTLVATFLGVALAQWFASSAQEAHEKAAFNASYAMMARDCQNTAGETRAALETLAATPPAQVGDPPRPSLRISYPNFMLNLAYTHATTLHQLDTDGMVELLDKIKMVDDSYAAFQSVTGGSYVVYPPYVDYYYPPYDPSAGSGEKPSEEALQLARDLNASANASAAKAHGDLVAALTIYASNLQSACNVFLEITRL